MNLYLLRHGLAVESDPESFPDDSRRPLTLKGEDRVGRVCDAMRALEVSFDRILASPFLRTRQTAEIVAASFGLRRSLDYREELAPEGDSKALIRFINQLQPTPENLLLVGHEPYLSRLMALLIAGTDAPLIELKKNGMAKLGIAPRLRAGRCATLNWLLTPRQLALLA